jgi:hypothetical protein
MRPSHGRCFLVASSLLAGCGLDLYGGLANRTEDGGRDTTSNDAATRTDDGARDAGAPDGAIGDSGAPVGDATGTGDDARAPADSGEASSPLATSCKTLLAATPSTLGKNGLYTIDPDGAGTKPHLTVYCEMSLDGGGWTLVGRSAPGGAPPFGWTTATGTPSDLAAPYSLDTTAVGLVFSEVLLADQAAGSLDAGTRAYKVSVPADFVTKYLDAAIATTPVTTVLGPCKPAGAGPTMLSNAGGTSVTDSFFFRDNRTFNDPTLRFGLLAHGFDTYYTSCGQGADLKGLQGLVFVR